ncbi:phospholipase-like protein, partial [Tanacetum coccineum]
MLDEDAVRLCLLIAGEYMWDKFYQRTVNVVSKHTEHHLAELKKNLNFNATYNLYGFAWAFKLSNPNVALITSPEVMRQSWFMASVDSIKGLADQDDKFIQDEEARVNCIEHDNGMCGDTEVDMPNFCSNHDDTSNHIGGLSTKAKEPSSSSSHPGNDKDASHLDDLMEIDGENVKDGYTNSQDHLHLLIKALESKTENPTLDVVVPPKDDDSILHTIKPNDAYDVVEVDTYDDDYMLMLNDEEKPVKSSLNDMELEQEPDKIAVKQGILEQQPNAPKVNTTVFEETVGVKVEEKPGLRRGLGPLKVKKNNCQRALRPNYVLRSAKDRKKKLAMALKPPFGQQSATTPVPKKRKSRIMKTEVIVPPFGLENLSRPDDCKSDKHLDLWTDLMWSLRPPEADWAIVSPHFSTCILSGMMPDYFSNGHMYPLPWQAVYFPVNEPKTHWCLAELKIRIRVVTFYDSLGWAGGSRRRWWRLMKKLLSEKLSVLLFMHGIFQSKGILADDYKITYKYADAPFQASLFGDCGIR